MTAALLAVVVVLAVLVTVANLGRWGR